MDLITEKAVCIGDHCGGVEFSRSFDPRFPKLKAVRCQLCCDLWQPIPEAGSRWQNERLSGGCDHELTRKCGIPLRYVDATLENYTPQNSTQVAAHRIAQEWVDAMPEMVREGVCRAFLGPVGTGKTHLMSSMLGEAHRAGYSARFVKCWQLIDELRDAVRGDCNEGERKLVHRLAALDVLGIDELDPETTSEAMWPKLWAVIDARTDRRKPTLMTSNLTPKELGAYFKDRIVSRITPPKQYGQPLVLVNGEDFRRK